MQISKTFTLLPVLDSEELFLKSWDNSPESTLGLVESDSYNVAIRRNRCNIPAATLNFQISTVSHKVISYMSCVVQGFFLYLKLLGTVFHDWRMKLREKVCQPKSTYVGGWQMEDGAISDIQKRVWYMFQLLLHLIYENICKWLQDLFLLFKN